MRNAWVSLSVVGAALVCTGAFGAAFGIYRGEWGWAVTLVFVVGVCGTYVGYVIGRHGPE